MGTSLVNIDRTHGHLTQDGHEHAVELLDSYGQETADLDARGRFVDVASPSLVTSVAANTV